MKTKTYTRSFAGGVVSPNMVGRIDDSKRDSGVASARNMIILPEGVATSRPGTKYVLAAKNADKKAVVRTFRYSSTQTLAMEFGEAYIRFHSFGATLLTPTTGLSAYSAVPTYDAGDLVTYGGSTWYAVTDVPANKQPDLFEYGSGTPVVTASWVASTAILDAPPAGYENVGTELPASVTVGALVYISFITYIPVVIIIEGIEYVSEGSTPVPKYIGYTGTAVGSSAADYWYRMGTYYEIPSPYAEADLFDLHYVQSGDVFTIVHPKYAPRELRRLAATTWVLAPITFGSTLSAPAISAVTPTAIASPSDFQAYSYVATSVSDDQTDESVQSAAVATSSNQLFDTGAFNTVTFADAVRRNVYRLVGGIYGFIGQTVLTTLIDDNIAPDISKTPPLNQDPFATDWPGAVTYYQQRRGFAGTPALPQSFWLAKSATESNLDNSIPVRDNDAIAVRIAAREASVIRHMVPLGDLILLTSSGEFSVTGNGGPLTPLNVDVPTTGYTGANNVQPVVVTDDLVYAAARGGHLIGMGYSNERRGYVSVDLSVRAAHLFDFKTITDLAFTRAPTPLVWGVSSDGKLVGMTYVPDEEVRAFHSHETDGSFESVCAVSEGDEDILYAVVKREIEAATVRYIECFAPRFYTDDEDAYFVDCGVTYDSTAATTISGLDHLEGETVNILADGAVVAPQAVVSGDIVLDVAASVVHIGLPLQRELKTLPVAAEEVPAFAQGAVKNLNKVWVSLISSGAFFAGPQVLSLVELPARRAEGYGAAPDKRTEQVEITLPGEWNNDGQVFIISSEPMPLTVASITKEVEIGG